MNIFLRKIYKEIIIKECISVQITFLFFYFNNTLRCYNRIKQNNANTVDSPAAMSKNIKQKDNNQGVLKCSYYFSVFLFFSIWNGLRVALDYRCCHPRSQNGFLENDFPTSKTDNIFWRTFEKI